MVHLISTGMPLSVLRDGRRKAEGPEGTQIANWAGRLQVAEPSHLFNSPPAEKEKAAAVSPASPGTRSPLLLHYYTAIFCTLSLWGQRPEEKWRSRDCGAVKYKIFFRL